MPDTYFPCFIVDGVDFTSCISITGFGWEYNDVDDEESGRPKDLLMRRALLGTKRKLTLKGVEMDFARLHALAAAIHKEFIDVTYLDPEEGGRVTKTFYGTKLQSAVSRVQGGKCYWDNIAFELVER